MNLKCDPAEAANWTPEQKAEFIRWYTSSRYAAKVPGATACYELLTA